MTGLRTDAADADSPEVTDELELLSTDDVVLGRRVAEHLLAVDESLRAALAAILAAPGPAASYDPASQRTAGVHSRLAGLSSLGWQDR